jgi:hypothetical protein
MKRADGFSAMAWLKAARASARLRQIASVRLVAAALEPFLDVEIEAVQPVVLCHVACMLDAGHFGPRKLDRFFAHLGSGA